MRQKGAGVIDIVREAAVGFEVFLDFLRCSGDDLHQILLCGEEDIVAVIDEKGLGDLILGITAAFQFVGRAFGIKSADLRDGTRLRSAAVCTLLCATDDPYVASGRDAQSIGNRIQTQERILVTEESHGVDLNFQDIVVLGCGKLSSIIHIPERIVDGADVQQTLRGALPA